MHHLVDFGGGSSVWNDSQSYLSVGGWSYTMPILSVGNQTDLSYNDGTTLYTCSYNTGFVFFDPHGGTHALPLTAAGQPQDNCNYFNITAYPQGGDDFYQATIGTMTSSPIFVSDNSGTVYKFPNGLWTHGTQQAAIASVIEDRNGNQLTIDDNSNGSFDVTDTLQRKLLSSSGFGQTGNTVSVSGLSQPYTLTWANVSVGYTVDEALTFHPSGYCLGPSNLSETYAVVTAIQLPNGEQYTLSYDPTYGLINKITYPTGGYVSYTWGINPASEAAFWTDGYGNNNACYMRYGSVALQSRSVSYDGSSIALTQSFTYSTTWPSDGAYNWSSKKTTVTTTDMTRQGHPSFTKTYTYSPILAGSPPNTFDLIASYVPVEQAVSTTDWNGNSIAYVTKSWADQYTVSSITTNLNGMTRKSTYAYVPYTTIPMETDTYDFGNGSAGTLLGKQITNYATLPTNPFGFNILDRPLNTMVFDGNGNRIAETDYSYDESPLASVNQLPSGTHDENNYSANSSTGRGNATTIRRKCFTQYGPCADAVTTYSYDET
ncbi:MAG TPA: hypothetical protein VFU48_15960, partial [Nitrospira sp.]|nr:hypothetical protein [Nitrospira sp.]